MTKYDEILLHLTDLEVIAETLEETRKEKLLDMIDTFHKDTKELFDEPTGDEDKDVPEVAHIEREIEPIAGVDDNLRD